MESNDFSAAKKLLEAGKLEDAKALLTAKLQEDSKSSIAKGMLATTLLKLGQLDQSIALYEELVYDNPADPPLRLNLGSAFLMAKRFEEAVDQLLIVLDFEPDHKKALGFLGAAYANLGRFEEAQTLFIRCGNMKMAEKMERSIRERDSAASTTVGAGTVAAMSSPKSHPSSTSESKGGAPKAEKASDTEADSTTSTENAPLTNPASIPSSKVAQAETSPQTVAMDKSTSVRAKKESATVALTEGKSDRQEAVTLRPTPVANATPSSENNSTPTANKTSAAKSNNSTPSFFAKSPGTKVSKESDFSKDFKGLSAKSQPEILDNGSLQNVALFQKVEGNVAYFNSQNAIESRANGTTNASPPNGSSAATSGDDFISVGNAKLPYRIGRSVEILIRKKLHTRISGLMISAGNLTFSPLTLPTGGIATDESEDEDMGKAQLLTIQGNGSLNIAPEGRTFVAIQLNNDRICLRRKWVYAFSPDLNYEISVSSSSPGKKPLCLLQLKGTGSLLLALPGSLFSQSISDDVCQLPQERLVGWKGNLHAQLPNFSKNGQHLADDLDLIEMYGTGTLLFTSSP